MALNMYKLTRLLLRTHEYHILGQSKPGFFFTARYKHDKHNKYDKSQNTKKKDEKPDQYQNTFNLITEKGASTEGFNEAKRMFDLEIRPIAVANGDYLFFFFQDYYIF